MDGRTGRSSAEYRNYAPEEPSSEPGASSLAENGIASDIGGENSLFVRHRVRKRDTLAGLAVKYNIAVSDIKRANGFESDTAMFGRELLLIPTKPLPIGPEYAAWAAILVSEISKIQSSSSTGNLRPSMAAALSELRGYYSTGQSPADTPLSGSDDEEDTFNYLRHTQSPKSRNDGSRREVELSALPVDKKVPTNISTAALGFSEDRLRRRKHGDDQACVLTPFEQSSSLQSAFAERGKDAIAHAQLCQPGQSFDFNFSGTSQTAPWRSSHARGASTGDVLGELRVWHRKSLVWRDQFLQKLKKSASNTTLMVPRTSVENFQSPSNFSSISGPLGGSGSIHAATSKSGSSMSVAAQGRGGPHALKDSRKAD